MAPKRVTVNAQGADAAPSPDVLRRATDAVRTAVRAGQLAPTFRLQDARGETHSLLGSLETAPLLITFYRGLWCDYCRARLEALAKLDPEIRALGAQQVVIGPTPRDDAEKAWLASLPMPVLLDRDLRITVAYGMSIDLPDDLRGRYTELGYSPASNDRWIVPVPASLLVEPTGRVALAVADVDYRTQIAPAGLLAALRGLQKRRDAGVRHQTDIKGPPSDA
ncbi:MAG TPA: peroxiredoxin-like family protein [Dongiaceae bacterium]|nr:peroxiredoxin-like family protein [Dongiaceae bacterium]